MATLELRNLSKVYGNGFTALHGINLTVRDGEFMAVVGPSGCAKSTTLRMIAGLESVTSGEIRIGDRLVNNIVPGSRGISMVFQNYALYPHMKVARNLSFGLRLARRPKAEIASEVNATAALLEIEQLLDRLPKQLSGGQAQRVAVGRAIIKKPELFLFDEPLSNLDAKLRASMRVRLIELHRQLKARELGSTAIYVTHDQTEAMTMGDRICVMKDGRIMQVADPMTLYDRPADAFVAGFIGSPEMNLLPVALSSGSGGPTLSLGGQTIQFGQDLAERLPTGRSDGPFTLGVRPQHLTVVPPDDGNSLVGRLSHIEFLGHEVCLHLDVEGTRIVAIVPAAGFDRSLFIDDAIRLRPIENRVHLFDAETGLNVSLGREAAMGRPTNAATGRKS